MPRVALILGIFLMGILLVPGIVQDAEAMTEAECLALTNLSSSELSYTVVTCENPFYVDVQMGQRLHIQNPNGGSSNELPAASYGSPGTYPISSGEYSGSTITLVNPSFSDLALSSPSVVTSGSSYTVTYSQQKLTSGYLESATIFTMLLDSSGEVITTRYDTLSSDQVNELGITRQMTACCLPNATPVASVAVYIVNIKSDVYLGENGTEYAITPNVYAGSAQITQLTLDSFSFFEDGTQTRYSASGDAPPSTNLTFTMTKPDGSDGDYNGSAGTGAPAYNHGGLISPTSSLMYGTWNLKICAPEYDVCVEKDFTINAPADASSNVDLAFLDEEHSDTIGSAFLKPYPDGATTISPGMTGFYLQGQMKNTGTGIAISANSLVKIIDPNGNVVGSQYSGEQSIGPDSNTIWNIIISPLDASSPTGTWTYTVTLDPDNKVSETDETNNVLTGTFEVVSEAFVDTISPVLTPTAYSYWEDTTNPAGRAVTFPLPSATDNIAVVGGVTCNPPSGSFFNVGWTTVTCSASDAAGNTGTYLLDIVVELQALDLTPPTINLPSDLVNGITLTASDSSGAVIGGSAFGNVMSMAATDNVEVEIFSSLAANPTYANYGRIWESGDFPGVWCDNPDMLLRNVHFPIGTTTINCAAMDSSGNIGTASFTVTVTPPQYTIEFNSNSAYNSACEGTNSCMNPYQLDIPVGGEVRFMNNDNAAHMTVSGNPVAGASGHWTSSLIPSGQSFEHTFSQSGTYEYYDSFFPHIKGKIVVGNDSTLKTGSSADTTPPVVNVPSDQSFSTTDPNGYNYDYGIITATDNSGQVIVPVCEAYGDILPPYSFPEAGPSRFAIDTTTVTCTATDAAGNTGNASFTVTVTAQNTSTQLTIDTFEIYHTGSPAPSGFTRYHVTGDAPASSTIKIIFLKPNGSQSGYEGNLNTGQPAYDHDGMLYETSGMIDGEWTMRICVVESGFTMNNCIERNFTWDSSSQTTSSSLNSYTEPHSGFVFKYPDTLEGFSFNVETNQPTNSFKGIQILSMKSTDDYSVCNNCVLLEYTIKNTTPYYISYINLYNQLYQNGQSLDAGSIVDVGNYDTYGSGNRVELAPGDTGVLSTRVTGDALLNQCIPYTSGICDAHVTSATIQAGSISNQSTNQSGSSSLEMITDKTTIDRNNPNDFATVSTTFNNLSGSSIDWNINTPDGREWRHDSMTWSQASNPIIKQFYLSPTVGVQNDSFTLTATDGVVTSNEIQFQVLPFHNATSSPMYASSTLPTITASAYDNSTSPTGRTLLIETTTLSNIDWMTAPYNPQVGSSLQGIHNMALTVEGGNGERYHNISFRTWNEDLGPVRFEMPVPSDWNGGNYNISLKFLSATDTFPISIISDGTYVTIPSLSEPVPSSTPLPNPSVTASVYANASSPTGRTLGIETSGLENYLTTTQLVTSVPITVTVSKNNQNVMTSNLVNQLEYPERGSVTYPIPDDWQGEYTVNWNVRSDWVGNLLYPDDPMSRANTNLPEVSGISSVTVPSSAEVLKPLFTITTSKDTLNREVLNDSFNLSFSETVTFNLTNPLDEVIWDAGQLRYGSTQWLGLGAHFLHQYYLHDYFTIVATDDTNIVKKTINIIGGFPANMTSSSTFKTFDTTVYMNTISSQPKCEFNNQGKSDCYGPNIGIIGKDGTVTFSNNDIYPHTAVSGTPSSGPSGHWDSLVIMPGRMYTTPPIEQGTYHYFCIIHPWMKGQIISGTGVPIRTAEPIVGLIDVTSPIIDIPKTINISTTNSTGAVVFYDSPTATDNNELTATPYCTPSSGTIFPVGTSKVICSVTDDVGNNTTITFEIIVTNSLTTGGTIAPMLTQPSTITVDATTANGAIVEYALPLVKDSKLVTFGPICKPESGSFFEIGSTPVTCIAKDTNGNQGTVAFLVDVKSKIVIPDEVKTSVSANLGKPSYESDDAIFITGAATPVIDKKVKIEIKDPMGILVGVEQADVEENGTYTSIVFPSSLWSIDGTYSLISTYGMSQDLIEFEFLTKSESQQSPSEISKPTTMNLTLEDESFNTGTQLKIDAQIDAGAGHSIILSMEGPDGRVLLQPLYTNNDGQVNLSFALSDELTNGVYTITAHSSGSGYDVSENKDITIITPLPELTVTEVMITSEDGSQVSEYNSGELAYFNTNLTTESTTPVLVTVNVFDSQGNTLGVGFFKSKIGEGDSEIVLGFELPDDLISGVAEVYTNVFTDWPDQGGVPITDEIKASVQIIGVAPVIEESVIEETVSEIEEPVPEIEEQVELDFTPPVVTVPPNKTFTAVALSDSDGGGFGYAMAGTGMATYGTQDISSILHGMDDIDGRLTAYCNSDTLASPGNPMFDDSVGGHSFIGYIWPVGTHTLSCYSTDTSGNVGTASFTITVTSLSVIEPLPEVKISHVIGSAVPGCEPNCFSPSDGFVTPGGIVIWENIDNAPHTTTSGIADNGPDGLFDSGLLMPGQEFSHTFNNSGEYDYFCMVHPWMIGKITVSENASTLQYPEPQIEEKIEENIVDISKHDIPTETDMIFISTYANSPECDIQKNCLSPYHASVTINQNVTWTETPFATTIVSGNPSSGPDGLFDFGFKINEKSTFAFNQTGVFQYFDMMHPWIAGNVTVITENFLMHLYNTLQTQLLLPSAFAVTDFPIKTDSDSYTHGQIVKVSGMTSEKNISLQVKDPSGKTVLIRSLPAEGNFFFDLNLPNYFKIGQYNIFASVTVDGVPKIVSKSIYLLDENGDPGTIHKSSIIVKPEISEEQIQTSLSPEGGGCLIATAAFGSEMAPQVQFLRELRDNTVLQTQSGTTFMTGFNQFYYSFSPYVADYERENPVFKEAVKVTLTPMLTSLTLLNYVDVNTEEEMLGYGIGIILLNIGMYFVAPAALIIALKKRFF